MSEKATLGGRVKEGAEAVSYSHAIDVISDTASTYIYIS